MALASLSHSSLLRMRPHRAVQVLVQDGLKPTMRMPDLIDRQLPPFTRSSVTVVC
ncbi:MAG: hypothetical protein AAF728_08000 [Cyanobacteria bacterium P01_D01_bin.128]